MQSKRVYPGMTVLRWLLPLGLIAARRRALASARGTSRPTTGPPYPLPPTSRFNARATLPNESTPWIDHARVPVEARLLRGETVADVFGKLGLQGGQLRAATDALAGKVDLRTLKAGNHYSAFFNPDASLASFEMTLDGSGRVEMARQGGRLASDWQPFQRRVEVRSLQGTLDGLAGGVDPRGRRTAVARLPPGRRLPVGPRLHQGSAAGGPLRGPLPGGPARRQGSTTSARSWRRSTTTAAGCHEAYRYGDASVYYDGDGAPMRKMFLRSPLRYSHITSSFSLHRFHPVLNEFRPHYGVDYGAPVGTPVQVTANGIVLSAGWDGGGGNVVKVQHGGGYVTAYLHLSRFAPGIRRGRAGAAGGHHRLHRRHRPRDRPSPRLPGEARRRRGSIR